MRNENPSSVLSSRLLGFVFSLFTFSNNFSSTNLIMLCITRFAEVSLDTYTLTSSAYLTNECFRLSNSLSNSSRMILDNIGLNGEPCGVPSLRGLVTPPSIIPLVKYPLMSFSVRLSVTFFFNRLINLHNCRYPEHSFTTLRFVYLDFPHRAWS